MSSSGYSSPRASPRNRMAKGDKSWIEVQRHTFTNWTNEVLRKSNESIKDLQTDLSDGFMLKCMYEVLSDKDFGRFKKAKMRISKVENLSRVLKKFSGDGLRLVNIGAEDICDGNLKIILGLIWSLITKYQIMAMREQFASAPGTPRSNGDSKPARKQPASPKKILLAWVNAQLANYPTEVKNFRQSWKDGNALCDLVDSFAPNELLPANDRPEGALSRIEKAMSIAEKRLGVPRVLEREHLLSGADDLSTMTYISYFQKAKLVPEEPPTPKLEPQPESKLAEEAIPQKSPKKKSQNSPKNKAKLVTEKPPTPKSEPQPESKLAEEAIPQKSPKKKPQNSPKNKATPVEKVDKEDLETKPIVDNKKTQDDTSSSKDPKRSSGARALNAKKNKQQGEPEVEENFAAKSVGAKKKRGKKKKVRELPCNNCKRVLPERNFKMFQKTKGELRQCERCVRREPVFTDEKNC